MLHSFLAKEVGAECCGGSAALLLHETGPTIIGHSESTEPQCHAQYTWLRTLIPIIWLREEQFGKWDDVMASALSCATVALAFASGIVGSCGRSVPSSRCPLTSDGLSRAEFEAPPFAHVGLFYVRELKQRSRQICRTVGRGCLWRPQPQFGPLGSSDQGARHAPPNIALADSGATVPQ